MPEQVLATKDVFWVVNRPERQGRVSETVQIDREPERLAGASANGVIDASILVLSAGLPYAIIDIFVAVPLQSARSAVLIMSRARNVQPAAAFKNNKTYFAGSVDTAPSRKSRIRNSRPALV